MTYEYHATAINVVDGDTCDLLVDLGLRVTITIRVRLYGIDTPEVGTPGGAKATHALEELVFATWPTGPTGPPLLITTVKPHDKYGRWLARIATPTCPDVAEALIAGGFGVAYYGGGRV